LKKKARAVFKRTHGRRWRVPRAWFNVAEEGAMLDFRPSLLLALGMFCASCVEPPDARTRSAQPPSAGARGEDAGNVVLVTIDGVRWQEIFAGADPSLADASGLPHGAARTARGLTPNLHRLFFDQGTVLGDPRLGKPLNASGPRFVSLPGYVEMVTGAASGCVDNECEPRLGWDVVLSAGRTSPPGQGAAVFASWERIARTVPGDASGTIVQAGRGPRDDEPPYPGNGDYRPDRRTAALAMDYLVSHRPRFLWIALGDTDEWAHRRDYRGYLEALRFADDVVGELSAHLAELGSFGARTTLLVTTDHGRDRDFAGHGGPASAGVWLMARGGPVAARGPLPLSRVRHLRDVAPTISALLGEPSPGGAERGEVLDELW
jgi:hypothetical protein